MNILFLCTNQATKNASGGIARVTINLSELFSDKGNRCRMAYFNAITGQEDGCFEKSICLTPQNQLQILMEQGAWADVFIVQVQMSKAYLYLIPILDSIREKSGTKIIYCHHNMPFTEVEGNNLRYLHYLLFHSQKSFLQRIKDSLWCIYSMAFPMLAVKKIAARRQFVMTHMDMTVLLSDRFVPGLVKYVDLDKEKLTGIGNCFTYKDYFSVQYLQQKEKTVLVVSNMTERAKRISTALKIWKLLNNKINDWNLVLVGDGEDLNYYKRLAQKYKLKNISFVGRQNPLDYYKKGQILMLTSAYEGFGMVILEAQQMGCVPVVFDSYQSVYDLIDDGRNGILVKNNDYKLFTEKLYSIMTDHEKLFSMAKECLKGNPNFTTDAIWEKWDMLFNKLGVQ